MVDRNNSLFSLVDTNNTYFSLVETNNTLISLVKIFSQSIEELPSDNCEEYIPDDSVFINSFIISISAAPGNIWTIFHMDKLGRKFFLCLSMLLSGGTAFLIYIVNSATLNLVLSCLFGAVSTMGFNSLDCLSVEVMSRILTT